MESELFGYEKGAFTGAREKGKMGLFELANHGTILLDEIGDMSLSLQAKLLRTIQENEIMRVGGTHPVKLDVRLISATSRNIEEMVDNGQFLDALYYRLNVVELDIPPLRKRQEDIIPLAEFYLQHFCEKYQAFKRVCSGCPQLLPSIWVARQCPRTSEHRGKPDGFFHWHKNWQRGFACPHRGYGPGLLYMPIRVLAKQI